MLLITVFCLVQAKGSQNMRGLGWCLLVLPRVVEGGAISPLRRAAAAYWRYLQSPMRQVD